MYMDHKDLCFKRPSKLKSHKKTSSHVAATSPSGRGPNDPIVDSEASSHGPLVKS